MLSDACQVLSSLHHLSFPHEKSWGFWDQLFCCWVDYFDLSMSCMKLGFHPCALGSEQTKEEQ